MKRGPNLGDSWRLRYCILDNSELTYAKDVSSATKGMIEIHKDMTVASCTELAASSEEAALVANLHPASFVVHCASEQRTWYFDAHMQDKLVAWTKALRAAILYCSPSQVGPEVHGVNVYGPQEWA